MKWQIKHQLKQTDPQSRIQEIKDILLKNRGLTSAKQIAEFFSPPPPEQITLSQLGVKKTAVNKAINRIKTAIKNQEQIIVYGDYDADGVCATAIIWETLHQLGAQIMPYIPDRFTEGYGMKVDAIKKLQSQYPNLKLIITVDQGIVAFSAADYCAQHKIDLIITDHHQPETKLPSSYATLHSTKTSGSGVAYWFAQQLIQNSDQANDRLDLATIGTVADLLPLLDINRSLVTHGLPVLRTTKRPGLLALFTQAGIKPQEIDTYHISFLIAPRLNAMGRLEHALDSLRLLCTHQPTQAARLAQLLNTTNQTRQDLTQQAFEHASQLASRLPTNQKIIIVGDHTYPEGIIGLIAGKLVEKFSKPAIVFSYQETLAKASARSIPSYNIIEAIRTSTQLLVSAGGHPMAAGLSLEPQHLEEFTHQLVQHAGEHLSAQDLQSELQIDSQIELTDINDALYQQIQTFAPFGYGNPTPVFATLGAEVISARSVGRDNKHLKLQIKQANHQFQAIAFNQAYHLEHLSPGDAINIAYQIVENVWNHHRSLELKVKDIKTIN